MFNQLLTADLVISVLDARKLLTMSEIDKLQDWLLQRGINTAVFVLNFINMIEQLEEQKEILQRARFIAKEFRGNFPNNISNLYRVDALPALRAKVKGDNNLAIESGITTFENAFNRIIDLLLPQIEQVRLPRVHTLGERFKQSLEYKLQSLKHEMSYIDRERNIIIQRGRDEAKQLKDIFNKSVEALETWLEFNSLVCDYQSELASALEKGNFTTWQSSSLANKVNNFQKLCKIM